MSEEKLAPDLKLKTWLTVGHVRLRPGTTLHHSELGLEPEKIEEALRPLVAQGLVVALNSDGSEMCWKCAQHAGARACSLKCFVAAGGKAEGYGAHVSKWEADHVTRGQPREPGRALSEEAKITEGEPRAADWKADPLTTGLPKATFGAAAPAPSEPSPSAITTASAPAAGGKRGKKNDADKSDAGT